MSMLIGPVGSPRLVRSTSVTSNSISLEWEKVDCLEQNGPIIAYTVSYRNGQGQPALMTTSNLEITLTQLLSDELYTIIVAASNAVGNGPFSPELVVSLPIAGKVRQRTILIKRQHHSISNCFN